MAITLGGVPFDIAYTGVVERYEEAGGRDARRITLDGLIAGASTIEDIEAQLDAILDAASREDYTAELSLRPGRRLWVRRERYVREVSREELTGAFTLELAARDPFEESIEETALAWAIAASGAELEAAPAGNVFSLPRITLIAIGDIVEPAFSDGVRTIAYHGTVPDGQTLVFDSATGKAALGGEDVTSYTSGVFPRLAPEGTVLVYTDAAASAHTADASVAFRDRWW